LTRDIRTGIILSGGRSKRIGRDKGLVELDTKPLISWVIDAVQGVTDEVIVVVGSEKRISQYQAVVPRGVHVIPDFYQEDSPLIGLISGLREAKGEYAVICACDMPFVVPEVLELLFTLSEGKNGTLLVKPNGWIEPIPSVYHVSNCLKYAEVLRGMGEMRIRKVLETMVDTMILPVEKLRGIDPDLVSFVDLDTLESIEEARKSLRSNY
jgi:molybdopterin-guanine dinucleotide biosynthesis protein A